MDSKNDHGIDQTYRLLALCARAEGHPVFYEMLADQLHTFTAWQYLPAQAEAHGMASLLRHHIHKSGIAIPQKTQQTLNGLYMRNRSYNQIHARVLTEIVSLFERAGIRPLVLKGLALAYQYYPDPALRPTSDIDLLLKQEDVLPALRVLANADFKVRFPSSTLKRLPKELTADSPLQDGTSVRVELHHYDPNGRADKGASPDPEFKGFEESPQIVHMNGNIIYTSAPMETLHYLLRHFAIHLFIANENKPVQLKWIADITSLVERHTEEIDWTHLQQNHPDILNRLEVFYSLTPLPEHLKKVIPIRQVSPPSGINQYPPGWPHQSIRQWKRTGYLRFIRQTFAPPSDWWLRLHYGIGEQPLFWHKHILYRIEIIKAAFWALINKTNR